MKRFSLPQKALICGASIITLVGSVILATEPAPQTPAAVITETTPVIIDTQWELRAKEDIARRTVERRDEQERLASATKKAQKALRKHQDHVADRRTQKTLRAAAKKAQNFLGDAREMKTLRRSVNAALTDYQKSHRLWDKQQKERAKKQAEAKAAVAQKTETTSPANYAQQVKKVAAQFCPSATVQVDAPFLNGHAGTADWYNGVVGVRSGLPHWRSVTIHECAHIKQYKAYGGDVNALMADMNAIYATAGTQGLEQNADCIALRWGATWVHYTSSCSGQRGAAATAVVNGRRPLTG